MVEKSDYKLLFSSKHPFEWGNSISTYKRMNVDQPTLYIKINLKSISDLNIRSGTIKPLEGNIEVNLHDVGFGKEFSDMI